MVTIQLLGNKFKLNLSPLRIRSSASIILKYCFLTVEMKLTITQNCSVPLTVLNNPEIFCCILSMYIFLSEKLMKSGRHFVHCTNVLTIDLSQDGIEKISSTISACAQPVETHSS